MDRLTTAFSEISAALEEHKHQRDEALKREAELGVQLEAERAQFQHRESNLIAANERLMLRVEELSATVARLQAEVISLTRAQNVQILTYPGNAPQTPAVRPFTRTKQSPSNESFTSKGEVASPAGSVSSVLLTSTSSFVPASTDRGSSHPIGGNRRNSNTLDSSSITSNGLNTSSFDESSGWNNIAAEVAKKRRETQNRLANSASSASEAETLNDDISISEGISMVAKAAVRSGAQILNSINANGVVSSSLPASRSNSPSVNPPNVAGSSSSASGLPETDVMRLSPINAGSSIPKASESTVDKARGRQLPVSRSRRNSVSNSRSASTERSSSQPPLPVAAGRAVKSSNSYAAGVRSRVNSTDEGTPVAAAAAVASGSSASTGRSDSRSSRSGGAIPPSARPVSSSSVASTRSSVIGNNNNNNSLVDSPPTRPDVRAAPYDIDGSLESYQSSASSLSKGPSVAQTVQTPVLPQKSAQAASSTLRLAPQATNSAMAITPISGNSNNVISSFSTPAVGHSGAPAPAPVTTVTKASEAKPPASTPALSASQFFGLLRSQVSASNLETLMAALSVFNKGSISKGDLLAIAEKSLKPDPALVASSGTQPVDLLSTFKSLILRV